MNDHSYSERGFDIREYLRVVRRRKWLFILVTAAVTAIGVGLSILETPTYQASALVLVPTDLQSTLNPNTPQIQNTDALTRQLQDEVLFAEGDQVKDSVRSAIGHSVSVTITPQADADALSFSTEAPTAPGAAREANAYANAYLKERRLSQTQDFLQTSSVISQQINDLRNRQKKLPSGDAGAAGIAAAIGTLQSSLADLRASGQLSRVGGDVVNTASVPSSPVSPNYPRNILIAAFLGVLLGLWLVFAIDRSDETINSKEDLDAVSGGVAAIGLIPWADEWRRPRQAYIVSTERPDSPAAEGYRALRTAVDVIARSEQLRTLAVTSAGSGEGKSTCVVNLGIALVRTGRRVTLIDCDLRRPRLHEFLGVENGIGLVSVLTGEVDLENAVQEIDAYPGLRLLPAGPQTSIPSELLSGPGLGRVLDELQGTNESDLVLLDCSPVLPVTDAMEVARHVEGMLLVVRAGTTRARGVRRMFEILDQLDVFFLGTILSGLRLGKGFDDGYYAYGYPSSPPTSNGGRDSNGIAAAPEARQADPR